MVDYYIISVLSLIGAMTIFYFALRIEESIMQQLTGAGLIESVGAILSDLIKSIKGDG